MLYTLGMAVQVFELTQEQSDTLERQARLRDISGYLEHAGHYLKGSIMPMSHGSVTVSAVPVR